MYLQFLSFLPTDKETGSSTPSSCEARTYLFYIVSIMGADDISRDISNHDSELVEPG